MRVLVTGAAGYIGSHAVRRLLSSGHDVVALDNFSRGHREALPAGLDLIETDLREPGPLAKWLVERGVECVMHFAAFAYVGESVEDPLLYYRNNTTGTLNLLRAVDEAKIRRLVFSSTCATYGEPEEMPIREETPQNPINPYGASKLFSERMLRDYAARRRDFACVVLRYFNVAGSAEDGSLGEHHDPEPHLIPVILQAALGLREKVVVFGTDYPTPDGTCVRDYIHVEDLVGAHEFVMQRLTPGFHVYNLGVGRGYSVNEIIEAARRVVGRPFEVEYGPRRPGDPPALYADPSKIFRELGWKAEHTDLEAIIASAWRWFQAHPHGY
jgi:UDP-glucose 4-epimerase